jgi:ComF family protein
MPILKNILNIIAPNQCLVCEKEGSLLCAWCLPDAFEPVPSRCFRCYKLTSNAQTCKACRKITPVQQVWVSTIYKGIAKKMVQHMKFNPDRSSCDLIAEWLDTTLPYFEDVIISYVPTSPQRVRQRGFDHSRGIAKSLAEKRNLPFASLLIRQGKTRQVGSERKVRIEQIKGAYQIKNAKKCKGRHILLVDDIVTTGATISEAARTLKRSGAKSVGASVFAQTI